MITWTVSHLTELSPSQVYRVLQLRSEVFVVEQTCPYQDMDDKDLTAGVMQLVAWQQNQPIACARLLPPGISYDSASIGRVATRASSRGSGLGHELMQRAVEYCLQQWPLNQIEIGAQEYLKDFYQGHGFEKISDTYLEDDIPHIHMKYSR